jgi:diguanylate cyclase (GGDEF)-like protein
MKGWLRSVYALVPASIAARGAVLIVLVILSVAGPGWLTYETQLQQMREHEQYASESFLAVALAGYLEHAATDAAERDSWMERIAALGRRVMWAGVLDAEGNGLEFRRRTALPQEQIIAQIDRGAQRPQVLRLRMDGAASERFELRTIPRPEDGVTLAVILDRGAPPRQVALGVPVRAMAAGMAGLLLAFAWFFFAIQRPLAHFGRRLASWHAGLAETAPASELPSELAGVAASVAETQLELTKWRGEATYLRHSVERTVDARTRRAETARQRAERDADTDPLTRLCNRRALERELPALFAAQQSAAAELAVIVFDVDRFKTLNDTRGHPAGDAILRFVGELLQATVRKGTDLAGRLGGDEFVLVLPATTPPDACAVARRLVALFAQRARTLGGMDPAPGLSAGVASLWRDRARSWAELLGMADTAMYWAKQHELGVATMQDVPSGSRAPPQ